VIVAQMMPQLKPTGSHDETMKSKPLNSEFKAICGIEFQGIDNKTLEILGSDN
jgi:hypothetical protein